MKIGLIQLTSTLDYRANLQKIRSMLSEASKNNVEAVFLPEAFYSISDGVNPSPYLIENENEHFQNILNLSHEFKISILGGSAATKVGDNILNRIYNVSEEGKLLNTYDKIHLFACDLSNDPSKQVLNEARIYTAGKESKLLAFKEWTIGLSICFDLRFPELFRHYFVEGANLLSVSSAFTYVTGKAHWHTLLRARAIENQSYVVACNQWGQHNDKMKTFGHSQVIDPWGEVLVDAGEGEKIVYAEISIDRVKEIRSRINVNPTIHYL